MQTVVEVRKKAAQAAFIPPQPSGLPSIYTVPPAQPGSCSRSSSPLPNPPPNTRPKTRYTSSAPLTPPPTMHPRLSLQSIFHPCSTATTNAANRTRQHYLQPCQARRAEQASWGRRSRLLGPLANAGYRAYLCCPRPLSADQRRAVFLEPSFGEKGGRWRRSARLCVC